MADWFHFTPESLRSWPRTRLLEAKNQLMDRLTVESRYRANAEDVEAKLSMIRSELRSRHAGR